MTPALDTAGPLDAFPAAQLPDRDPGSQSAATLRIEPWHDPVVDEVGHDPRSSYVEMYWLPVLGPSTTWMLRRLAAHLELSPAGVDLDPEELARGLGLGERFGPNAPFSRTVKRCVDFEMAQWRPGALAVRRRLPPLARRHLRRLPESLQERHSAEGSLSLGRPATDKLRLHGQRLAMSLFQYGEDLSGVEQQLARWAFEPGLATQCAAWAAHEHAIRNLGQVRSAPD